MSSSAIFLSCLPDWVFRPFLDLFPLGEEPLVAGLLLLFLVLSRVSKNINF